MRNPHSWSICLQHILRSPFPDQKWCKNRSWSMWISC